VNSEAGAPLPRGLLWVGIPVTGVVLVGFFFLLGFPYDLVRDALAAQLSAASGAQVSIQRLGPGLSPLGPQLVAEGVRVTLSDGTPLEVEHALLRPAWSLSWFSGTPALALDVVAPEGRLVGTLWIGSEPGFDGEVREVALARLPLQRFVPDLVLAGVANLDVDLRSGEDGPRGHLTLEARDGSVGIPGLPIDLPYVTLDGHAELGGESRVRVDRLVMDGPMLSVEASGTLGPGPRPETSPLEASLHVEVREQSVRPLVRGLGVRLDAQGRADVTLAGTPARPVVR
jgi:type II secretion system protein N